MSVLGVVSLGFGSAWAAHGAEVFAFKLPNPRTWALEAGASVSNRVETLVSSSESGPVFTFGRQLVVQVDGAWPEAVVAALAGAKVVQEAEVTPSLKLFLAEDAWVAARTAQRVAELPGVLASYPVVAQPVASQGRYAPYPADYHFLPVSFGNIVGQWYLENRDFNTGAKLGVDLNVRAAWPVTRGKNATVAVVDVGVELGHEDLKARTGGAPHWNFAANTTNGVPAGTNAFWAHGTQVAGLVGATTDNLVGGAGVAPQARLASWVIFQTNGATLSDDRLATMFRYASNVVSVQNHSWSGEGVEIGGPTALEGAAIDDAVTRGRDGKGVILVRSAGNDRGQGASANDDGYANDPRSIAVAAVNRQGRWASYSEPGSSVLVAAPSGDENQAGLFTTDLTGVAGANAVQFFQSFLSDYSFNSFGFSGTSASAPLVSGVAALVLEANPALDYRQVQQVIALSSRHFSREDPMLRTNQAGLVVSHNTGFGVPDAGEAVRLAIGWPASAPVVTRVVASNLVKTIPDGGLRLVVTGEGLPVEGLVFTGLPTTGAHPDVATPAVSLVDAGAGTNFAGLPIVGQAALIERSTNTFGAGLNRAFLAGARFGILYNFATNPDPNGCPGGDQLCLPGGTDTNWISGLFVSRTDGLRLKQIFATNASARSRLELAPAVQTFDVPDTLVVQHVGARVRTDHPLRGDLRITLVSPAGTRSVLQRYNADVSAGPIDWVYWSTHHLGESSAGTWRLEITDESPGATGQLLGASLIFMGREIVDTDFDGLADGWEQDHFKTLARSAADDVDQDGYSNGREQFMGTDPTSADVPFQLDLSAWRDTLVRLSWPSVTNEVYQVWAGSDPGALTLQATLSGGFPETEWFAPKPTTHRFFSVRIPAK